MLAAFVLVAVWLNPAAWADGLVYQIPAEGRWAEYDITLTSSDTVKTGTLRIQALGQTTMNGDTARWIELSIIGTNAPTPDELFRLLIPEQYLTGAGDITAHVLQAWYKKGADDPELVDHDRLRFGVGPVEMFLGTPRNLEQLPNQKLNVAGLGVLDTERETGQLELALDESQKRPANITVWRHTKAPFGSVQLRIDTQTAEGGVQATTVVEVTLVRTGDDAETAARRTARTLPPDRQAYTDAERLEDPEQRIAALEKFLIDFPGSSGAGSAHEKILETLVEHWPERLDDILARAEQVVDGTPGPVRTRMYSTVAATLTEVDGLLNDAEQFALKGLDAADKEEERARSSGTSTVITAAATLGRIYITRDKVAEAERLLSEVRAANPLLAAAADALSALASGTDRDAGATVQVNLVALQSAAMAQMQMQFEVMRSGPRPPTPPSNRATPPDRRAYTAANGIDDPEKKIEALDQFLTDFPSSFSRSFAIRTIVDTLVQNFPDRTDEIRARADKAIESSPDRMRSSMYNMLATTLDRAGILMEEAEQFAIEGLERARAEREERVKRVGRTTRVHVMAALGQVYLKQGKFVEAEQTLREAYDADPSLSAAAEGLAELATRSGDVIALQYQLDAALGGHLDADGRARLENLYRGAHSGSLDGLEAVLDGRYRERFPNPVTVDRYARSASRTDRVVLAEVFSGAGCPPCAAVDLAFEAVMERYSRADVAMLMYHVHVPVPDPMTNRSSLARAEFYGVQGVPAFFIDGTAGRSGGGSREMTQSVYDRITPTIDDRLESEARADLRLEVVAEGAMVKVKATVDGIASDAQRLTLRLVLVEDELSYSGQNGTRFHPMVVRSVAGVNAEGFPIDASRTTTVEHTFDLSAITQEIKAYLDDDEVHGQGRRITFGKKLHEIDPGRLSVVAFVQEVGSHRVLQAAYGRVELSR